MKKSYFILFEHDSLFCDDCICGFQKSFKVKFGHKFFWETVKMSLVLLCRIECFFINSFI